MNLQMLQTEIGGMRVFAKAFMETYIGTYWGSKVDCLLFNQKTSATTVRSVAGSDFLEMLTTIADLTTEVAGCIPGPAQTYTTGVAETASSILVLAGLMKDIASAIKNDMKYFLTLKESEIELVPPKIDVSAGEINLEGDPVNLEGNALAAYQATLDSVSGDFALLAQAVFTKIQLTEAEINQQTLDLKQEMLGAINTKAAEVQRDVLKVVETNAETTLNLVELTKDAVKATFNYAEANYESLSESISKVEENIEVANKTANEAMVNSEIALLSAIIALHTEES